MATYARVLFEHSTRVSPMQLRRAVEVWNLDQAALRSLPDGSWTYQPLHFAGVDQLTINFQGPNKLVIRPRLILDRSSELTGSSTVNCVTQADSDTVNCMCSD